MEDNRRHHNHSSDRLSSLVWALILIWAGVVFLADNTGMLNNLALPGRGLPFGILRPGAWTLVFLGAGTIVIIEIILRLAVPTFYSPNITGSLVFAAVLFGIGLGNLFGWDIIWPLILIAVGVSVLLGGMMQRRV